MVGLTSAAGLVGFLSEPDPALQAFALETLNDEIESVWTEVSGSIGQMYVRIIHANGLHISCYVPGMVAQRRCLCDGLIRDGKTQADETWREC